MWYDSLWDSQLKCINSTHLQVALMPSILDVYPHPKADQKGLKIKCDGIPI